MNHTISIQAIDEFIAIINTAIDSGNITSLTQAISDYENKIPIKYINISKNILYELLIENLETTCISRSTSSK
jgi:hypothetical protein